ncbi:MAG TPA: C40 family peptidase [Niabella sp.]|jgi:cell wall-associated NlpC family hydrolase|nr:C40 family peptidase [Chitinophagaceae bacterium]HRN46720.1 C40 family peptidase [Niabella sp.]HRO83674.1 C40 family peptidase [Niabella sp.]HUN02733.1 C40 family peptidase [Niabella sp.]
MKTATLFSVLVFAMLFFSCSSTKKLKAGPVKENSVATHSTNNTGSTTMSLAAGKLLNINRNDLIAYSKTYLGTPYLYASADPSAGLDCSGLLFLVFNHFGIKAPRASYNYENMGKTIEMKEARPGDLILFTGSDNKGISHIGIITQTQPDIIFLHSSSSKGVIESRFEGYYLRHFAKLIKVLE